MVLLYTEGISDRLVQVDARLLKAVAIEHSQDADAAVEFVLSDVLPFMSQQPESSGSCYEEQLLEDSSPGMGILFFNLDMLFHL